MFEKEKRYSFRQGLPKKVIPTPYFTFRFADAKTESGTNAVVVSKKVSKKAVVRNKIKRKALAVLKESLAQKEQSYDIVIYIKPQKEEFDNDLLEKYLKECIEKI